MPAKVYIRLYRGLIAVMLVFLIAMIVLVMSAYYIFTHKPLPQIQGVLSAKDLTGSVIITRDRWGVPHIQAENQHDLFFAAGYAQAQDRLFQMDYSRRRAEGRLAEWMGRDALPADRLARTVGIERQAARLLQVLPPESRQALEAFAQGVNAYARGRLHNLPVEYKALPAIFMNWQAKDSLAIALHQAWILSGNWPQELIRLQVADERGLDGMWKILPPGTAQSPYIMDAPPPSAEPPGPDQGARLDFGLPRLRPERALALFEADRLLGRTPGPYASNAWVVDGSRTESGKPLLANDPHLTLEAPSVWYEMHLRAPDFEVTGATLPGLPVIIIGHNRRAAWAAAASTADVADLFIEELDPDDPDRYLYQGRSLPFALVTETILIREDITHTSQEQLPVRISRHGPLLENLIAPADGQAVSLKWSGLEPYDPIGPFLAAARSSDFESFRRAVNRLGCPSLVWLFAGDDGEIGAVTNGLIPVRARSNGAFPVPAMNGDYDWQGYVPRDRLPWQRGAVAGLLVAANGPVATPEAKAPFLSTDWASPYRARRIRELLETRPGKLTREDFQEIQGDVVSLRARRLLPRLLEALHGDTTDERFDRAARQLQDWDGSMSVASSAPTIFAEVYDRAYRLTYEDEMSPEAFRLLQLLPPLPDFDDRLERGTDPLFDRRGTPQEEQADDIVREAFHHGLAALERTEGARMSTWQWGKLHTLDLAHPLTDRPEFFLNAGYFGMNRQPLPWPGGFDTVYAAAWSPGAGFKARWGSSLRLVLDWGDLEDARLCYPGGQSGQPFSPHYADLLKLWHNVEGHPMLLNPASIEAAREARLELVPVGGEVDAP